MFLWGSSEAYCPWSPFPRSANEVEFISHSPRPTMAEEEEEEVVSSGRLDPILLPPGGGRSGEGGEGGGRGGRGGRGANMGKKIEVKELW